MLIPFSLNAKIF